MCRLLGVIANNPVDLVFSLEDAHRPFKKFGDRNKNPDGWGIGWYHRGRANVFKEAIPAPSSAKLPELARETESNIIIAHVRKKGTGAETAKRNSHPFIFRNWLFAHNGSVSREHLIELLSEEYKESIEGETDSEIYFRWILQNIEEQREAVEGIKRAIQEVASKEYTGLNFLLSDGLCFYAFRHARIGCGYYSLFMLRRFSSHGGQFESVSKETEALLRSKRLRGEKAVLICSEKLTRDENWEEIPLGTLIEVKSDLKVRKWKIL